MVYEVALINFIGAAASKQYVWEPVHIDVYKDETKGINKKLCFDNQTVTANFTSNRRMKFS